MSIQLTRLLDKIGARNVAEVIRADENRLIKDDVVLTFDQIERMTTVEQIVDELTEYESLEFARWFLTTFMYSGTDDQMRVYSALRQGRVQDVRDHMIQNRDSLISKMKNHYQSIGES